MNGSPFDGLFGGLWANARPGSQSAGSEKELGELSHRLVKEFPGLYNLSLAKKAPMPALDLEKSEDSFVLKIDLPGFKRENIEISFKEGTDILIVTAVSHGESDTQEDKEVLSASGTKLVHSERTRYTSEVSRAVNFANSDICKDNVSAKFNDGVLTVVIPRKKKEEKAAQKINISD